MKILVSIQQIDSEQRPLCFSNIGCQFLVWQEFMYVADVGIVLFRVSAFQPPWWVLQPYQTVPSEFPGAMAAKNHRPESVLLQNSRTAYTYNHQSCFHRYNFRNLYLGGRRQTSGCLLHKDWNWLEKRYFRLALPQPPPQYRPSSLSCC